MVRVSGVRLRTRPSRVRTCLNPVNVGAAFRRPEIGFLSRATEPLAWHEQCTTTFPMIANLVHLSRNLRRSPASAAAAVLTIALTLGAGGSIFAVVQAVLLTPPPFADPDALVILDEARTDDPASARRPTYVTFDAWRARAGSLAALESFDGTNLTLTGLGLAERVGVTDATPGLLKLLGIAPRYGRGFEPADAGSPVVIVSHAFWRTKLAADPDVVGRQLVLGGRPHTVIGVLPEQFRFDLNASQMWRPIPVARGQPAGDNYRVRVVARLRGGVSAPSLAAVLDSANRDSGLSLRVVARPLTTVIRGGATGTLTILAAGAGLALLIAFANFAGLLIVRSIDRRRELAVRTALGAGRANIVSQVLIESQALVAIGTVGGLVLAFWLTPVVGRLTLAQFDDLAQREVTIGWQVIVVMALAASLCACIGALPPAFTAARGHVSDVLRRTFTPLPRERLLRRLFVAGEVSLAFVLLVSVTLLGQSLAQALRANPGFEPRGVLTMQVSLPSAVYNSTERVESFYSSLQRALENRFGERAVSIVDELPLTGDRGRRLVRMSATDPGREAVVRTASRGYFDVMRIPIARGRTFDGGDDSLAVPRVVVSASLADHLFSSADAIGRRIQLEGAPQPAEIIGVVGDVRHRAVDEPILPTLYVSSLQEPSNSSIVIVRTDAPDADVVAAVRQSIAQLDANVPVYGIRPMSEVLSASPGLPARRVLTATFTGFALLAVVLGAIGLFGVVAHDVASRKVELALRVALGADPMRIMRATFGQGAAIVAPALAVGALLSVWAARVLMGVGFAMNRLDALSIAAPAALLIVTTLIAMVPAARRAARTDPLLALRAE